MYNLLLFFQKKKKEKNLTWGGEVIAFSIDHNAKTRCDACMLAMVSRASMGNSLEH